MTNDDPFLDWTQSRLGSVLLSHPADWDVLPVEAPLYLLRASSSSPDGFSPNITVVERPGSVHDLDALLVTQIGELELLTDVLMLDAEETELARRPATRVLAAHRAGDDELTVEQWVIPTGRQLVTVSVTSAASHHADVVDLLDAIVTTVQIDD
jgi:hypothetical protein